MCEKAEEIQRAWKPVDWDRFIYKNDRELGIACVDDKYNKKAMKKVNRKYIWLPIQEQLQEMIKKRHIYYLIKDFQIFQVKHTVGLHINDMNKLWLAFVMYEKYNKIWTGKIWK